MSRAPAGHNTKYFDIGITHLSTSPLLFWFTFTFTFVRHKSNHNAHPIEGISNKTNPTMAGNGKSGKAGKKARSKFKAKSKFKARRGGDTMQPRVAVATFGGFSSSPGPPPSSVPRRPEPPRKLSIEYMNRIRNARGWKAGNHVLLNIEKDGYAPNVFHYSAIISKCAKQRQSGKALGLLKRMINQGVAPNAAVFCAVIDACAKAGQHTRAISLLNDMEDKYGVRPNANCFNAAISSCEKAAQWEEAVKLLRKMPEKGVEPDAISYNSVISACAKCAEWERALEFLAEMKKVNIPPNEKTYNSAISACEKGRQPDVALSLLAQMKKEGIRPDVISYSSVISACEKGGGKYTEAALSLLDEAKSVGIKLDVKIYSAAISACEKGGAKYTETALSLLTQMREERIRPDVRSYSSVISACEKGGAKYSDPALSLFHEMKKAGVNPSDATYTAITKALYDSKRYSEALNLAKEAAGLGLKERPFRINVSTESGLPKWDLHRLPEGMACMLLADALQSFVQSSIERASPSNQDIIVVTGKGRTTESKDPVLREKVPAFLNDIAGLEAAVIGGNEGRFLITAASLKKWVASGAYEKFKDMF